MPIRISLVAIPRPLWMSVPRDRPLSELAKDLDGAERRIRKQTNTRRELVRHDQLCTHIETVALALSRGAKDGLLGPGLAHAPSAREGIRCIEWSDDQTASVYIRLLEGLAAWSGPGGSASERTATELKSLVTSTGPGAIQAVCALARALRSDLHPGWLAFLPIGRARAAWSRIRLAWHELVMAVLESSASLAEVGGLTTICKSVFPPGRPVAEQREVFDRLNTVIIGRLLPDLDQCERMAFALLAREQARFYRRAERTGSAVVVVMSQRVA